MSYSRAFGMRSFENIVRDGRFRVPNTGTALKIGEPVMLDANNPGLLAQATAGVKPSAATGVVVFEHIQMQNIDAVLSVSADLDFVPLGRYAQMVHGAGAKVWFKNVGAKTHYDGRPQNAAALLADSVDPSALKPGDGLTPDGAGKYKKASGTDGVWLTVEQSNPSTGMVEARFNF